MAEANPHQQMARVLAYACYTVAAVVLVAGFLFTLAAATVDVSELPVKGTVTNLRMAVIMASMFVIIALMFALTGRRVRSLFGQERRQEKLLAKSAAGCLKLAGLGCGLWLVPSTATALMSGIWLANGEPLGLQDFFIAASGPVLVIIAMLSLARFISKTFVNLKGERAYADYLKRIKPRLPALADPETRAYVQEQTLEVVAKVDETLESALLNYLSRSRLLIGPNRITLHGADFRGVDLCSLDLPDADLSGINLERAKLQWARLYKANLRRARLNGADLSRANLQLADLGQADLTDAMLAGTMLGGASLLEALVTPAQLNQASLVRPRE